MLGTVGAEAAADVPPGKGAGAGCVAENVVDSNVALTVMKMNTGG